MSDIQKLFSKNEEHEIKSTEGPIKVPIKQLNLEDIEFLNFDENASMKDISKNAIQLISLSLGISVDEAKKISVENMAPLLEKIMEVNNFDKMNQGVNKIQGFMKQKQELIKKNKKNE